MQDAYAAALDRLTESSIAHDYDPLRRFSWPAALAPDDWTMPPELLSVYDTPLMDALDPRTLKALSLWESMNFYSMTLHGERRLIAEVSGHIHTPGFEAPSGFFHRFIGEENDHIWFFSEFCRRYGKIYPDSTVSVSGGGRRPELEAFLTFMRILIFEEIGDTFNVRMSGDARLPAIVRDLNAAHHDDESRHIAAGRQVAKRLHAQLDLSPDEEADAAAHLKQHITLTLQSLYNPQMYEDAGIPDFYAFRRELLRQPGRRRHHGAFLARSLAFIRSNGICKDGEALF
ncbi:MAG: diiron oxygenase [Elusimicrobia bacterium]|nr:diiron oxygenase [Elusimicrobiota bacterium]